LIVEGWAQSGFGQEPQAGDYELIVYSIGVVPERGAMALLAMAGMALLRRAR
jgi:hypothetical protein